MRTRSLALGIIVVAVVAVATIVILNASAEKRVAVIVSKDEIPAGELLDPLIERNNFKEIMIPVSLFVDSAVTDVDELRGTIAHSFNLANEQISTARLSTPGFST